MTADPSRSPEQPPAWYVVTDQGVRLAGPYATPGEALQARTRVVETMAEQMAQQRYSGAEIADRVRAVMVAYGVLVGPWQRFRAVGGDR